MNYDELVKETLLENSFKMGRDGYYELETPIVLEQSENFLGVCVRCEGDKVIITDRGQLLQSYDCFDIDYDDIKSKIVFKSKNLFFDDESICLQVSFKSVLKGVSDFIKVIICTEQKISKLLGCD